MRRLGFRLAVGLGVLAAHAVLARAVASTDPIASGLAGRPDLVLAALLVAVRLGLYLVVPGWITCALLPAAPRAPAAGG